METKQVVLITGGAKRLGLAMAQHLLGEGYRVVIHCNTSCGEAKALGDDCRIIQANLTNREELQTIFLKAVACFGQVDHLINNASVFPSASIEETTFELWDEVMAIHNTAPFFLSKSLYLHLVERGTTGSVVNMVDSKIEAPTASRSAYYISKGALLAQTKTLAVSLGPTLRVNAISPGAVLSNGDDTYFAKMAERLPLKHTGSAPDIVQAVAYLLHADFVTGTELPVDGGQRLL
ncbi:MAG: SDR family oxidoreductase [Sphaerochaeta sp.]|nr:SDR family oxidoreductase [Sphaerochaeta sp.]